MTQRDSAGLSEAAGLGWELPPPPRLDSVRGSPAARISDKYFITAHRAVRGMVSAAHRAPLPAWTEGAAGWGVG